MKNKKYNASCFIFNGKKLDKNQIKIIKSNRKTILVIAGAGSGKTFTIAAKVRYLIEYKKINPKEILCISFTNESVNSLKKSINNKDVSIMTFHKLALNIIPKRKEILSEDMLTDIIMDTFNYDVLYGLFKVSKNEMVYLIQRFINLFKSKNYNLDYFYKFINKANKNEKLLLKEIMKCYICYESYLNKEKLMDFNDIINLAIDNIDNYNKMFRYIIIDEFQDTSYVKLELIKRLIKKTKSNLIVVGDDFQSIYKFTGSDITIITRFRYYFLFSKIFKLNKTYRAPNELVSLAGKFIMKNPAQIKKKLVSVNNLVNSIMIIYYDDLNICINNIIKEDKINNLFILARNNKDLDGIKIENKELNYKKLTIHKSKGLEEDYVFVIGLLDKINGFPNKIKDHAILRFVNHSKTYYPFEEERRLFYVALTRCKKRVYIFTKEGMESIFIKELLKYNKIKKSSIITLKNFE